MSKVEIHAGGSFADSKRRVLKAVDEAARGPFESQTHVTFDSWPALAKVMTPKRLELLRVVNRQPAASVALLARTLRRDYKRVYMDVEALTAAGLLDRAQGDVRAAADEIRAVIAL